MAGAKQPKPGSARLKELNCLLEVAMTVNSSLDLDSALARVLEESMRVIQAEGGTIWLINKQEDVIEARVVKGPTASILERHKLRRGEGLAGISIDKKEAILVEDVGRDSRWSKRIDQLTGFATNSLLTVPVLWKGQAIGCIQLVNKKPQGLFSREDLSLAQAIANISAAILVNAQLYEEQCILSKSISKTLAAAIDARDPYTSGHSIRVAEYALKMGEKLGLSPAELQSLEISALLHDIGKIGLEDDILKKDNQVGKDERRKIEEHPLIGMRIITQMEPSFYMQEPGRVVLCHHEKFDGTGYPGSRKGEEIPLFARIVAIADAFDAMTSNRPYHEAWSESRALEEIIRCQGTSFDPFLVELFVQVMEKEGVKANDSI